MGRKTRLFLSAILLLFLASGCAWMNLSADYDPVLDRQTSELHQDTETFFTDVKAAVGTRDFLYRNNQEFYSSAKGRTTALITRAELQEEGQTATPLTENYHNLLGLYEKLETEHIRQSEQISEIMNQEGASAVEAKSPMYEKYWSSAHKSFQQHFRAVIRHIMVLKGIRDEQ